MNVLDLLILCVVGAVAVSLGFGLKAMFTPGQEARNQSNRLMRLRVALQAVAVVILVGAIWWKASNGG